MCLTITPLAVLIVTIELSGLGFYSGSFFPQCGQNFTSVETTRPQLVQTLVIFSAGGPGGAFSFLTMRYTINPTMPVMITMISHSGPLIPLDSASLYTQTQSMIAIINQTIGIRQKMPASPQAHSSCPIGIGIILLHLKPLLSDDPPYKTFIRDFP